MNRTIACCLIALSAFLPGPQLLAQSASDFFNQAANLYIANKRVEAIQLLEEGLRSHPEDEKLAKLLAKAKEEEQKQQKQQEQNKGQENKKEQEKKEQQQQDQQKQNQQQEDQQKQDQQKGQENQGQRADANEDQKKSAQMKKAQISKEDAERILEALKNEERDLQKKIRKVSRIYSGPNE